MTADHWFDRATEALHDAKHHLNELRDTLLTDAEVAALVELEDEAP